MSHAAGDMLNLDARPADAEALRRTQVPREPSLALRADKTTTAAYRAPAGAIQIDGVTTSATPDKGWGFNPGQIANVASVMRPGPKSVRASSLFKPDARLTDTDLDVKPTAEERAGLRQWTGNLVNELWPDSATRPSLQVLPVDQADAAVQQHFDRTRKKARAMIIVDPRPERVRIVLAISSNATAYDVYHEIAHIEHLAKDGFEGYRDAGDLHRELAVWTWFAYPSERRLEQFKKIKFGPDVIDRAQSQVALAVD